MGAVFFFHCSMFFTPFPWHLKNAETSRLLGLVAVFLDAWMMPLFFLLAGFSSWFALEKRGPGRYLRERAARLLVPFYGVGVLLLLPPQHYWDQVTGGAYQGGFLAFLPRYFATLSLGNSPHFLGFWPGHLWFLRFLFLVSLLALPVMLWCKTPRGRELLGRVAERPLALGLLWPALAVTLAGVLGQPVPGHHSWASLAGYLLFFLIGYVWASSPAHTKMLTAARFPLLALGLVCVSGSIACLITGIYSPFDRAFPPLTKAWGMAVLTVDRILWVAAIMGFGARLLQHGGAWLDRFSEAVLPFYVLHQTAILLVGSFIIPLSWGMGLKYAVIALISVALIMATYEGLIRRSPVLRFLFGMRPAK